MNYTIKMTLSVVFLLGVSGSAIASGVFINQIGSNNAPSVSVSVPQVGANVRKVEVGSVSVALPTPTLSGGLPTIKFATPKTQTSLLRKIFGDFDFPKAEPGSMRSDINQLGNDNGAAVFQSGSEHASVVSQTGNNNFASVSQTGSRNSSYVSQNGNGFSASVQQSGSGNRAMTIQSN